MEKTVLVVFAHPNSKSFCGALRDITVQKLTAAGYKVIESDLYQMGFNPVFNLRDVGEDLPNKDISMSNDQKKVVEEHRVKADAQAELDKLNSASYIIFIAPTWWGTVPAILKGWFDRVLLKGAAFDVPDGIFDQGLLKGKKCMLVTTTGWPKEFFEKKGKMAGGQTIEENYWHIIEGVFAFCGMETLPLFVGYAMDSVDNELRKKTLTDYEKTLDNIEKLSPIYCPLLHDKNKD